MEIQDEIERTWLLRNFPEMPRKTWDDVMYIEQFYTEHEGKKCRLRYTYNTNTAFRQADLRSIELIWKEKVGKGHNKEHHMPVDAELAEMLMNVSDRWLAKTRYVFQGDFKYEIDVFVTATMVKLEVEIPELNMGLDMPDFIFDEIVCELTGVPNFDNYNIAEKHNSI